MDPSQDLSFNCRYSLSFGELKEKNAMCHTKEVWGEPPTAHDHASATQSALIADTQALIG
jgi:hypothetical protein